MSLQGVKMILAPPVWRAFVAWAQVEPFDPAVTGQSGPFVFACLHRDILPAIMFVKSARPALLVSNSPDGDILVKTLGSKHYRFVRGATGSGGGRALVALRRELATGHSVGIAVDGPEGPYGHIQDGVFHLARSSGALIVPLVARLDRPLVLGSWDRTVVPVPLRKGTVEIGPLIKVGPDENAADLTRLRSQLSSFFEWEGVAP